MVTIFFSPRKILLGVLHRNKRTFFSPSPSFSANASVVDHRRSYTQNYRATIFNARPLVILFSRREL